MRFSSPCSAAVSPQLAAFLTVFLHIWICLSCPIYACMYQNITGPAIQQHWLISLTLQFILKNSSKSLSRHSVTLMLSLMLLGFDDFIFKAVYSFASTKLKLFLWHILNLAFEPHFTEVLVSCFILTQYFPKQINFPE